jgi:hypothetical protein
LKKKRNVDTQANIEMDNSGKIHLKKRNCTVKKEIFLSLTLQKWIDADVALTKLLHLCSLIFLGAHDDANRALMDLNDASGCAINSS